MKANFLFSHFLFSSSTKILLCGKGFWVDQKGKQQQKPKMAKLSSSFGTKAASYYHRSKKHKLSTDASSSWLKSSQPRCYARHVSLHLNNTAWLLIYDVVQ
jgi:hypothetical protein